MVETIPWLTVLKNRSNKEIPKIKFKSDSLNLDSKPPFKIKPSAVVATNIGNEVTALIVLSYTFKAVVFLFVKSDIKRSMTFDALSP